MKKILLPLFTVLFLGLVLNCTAVPDKNPYFKDSG
jgi:heat shock protein HslJ